MTDAIVIEQARKAFGKKVAVHGFDLRVPQGTMYGFIGPNGAGKTTTIRMVMSIIFPDSGRVEVLGRKSAVESKDRIGYLPEERGVYKKMKVGAFLTHIARLKGVDGAAARARVHQWLERVDLGDVIKKRCEELSKGMQQKVQFIASVVHEPELLILDEPFSGLDPVNMRLLRDLIAEQHAQGTTVIFSTHVMHQAQMLCDHIVMINDGKKVLDATLSEIRSRFDPNTIMLEPMNIETETLELERVDGIEKVQRVEGQRLEVSIAPGTDATKMIAKIAQAVPVARIELRRPTLEDVFIKIVEGSSVHPGAEGATRSEGRADGSTGLDEQSELMEETTEGVK